MSTRKPQSTRQFTKASTTISAPQDAKKLSKQIPKNMLAVHLKIPSTPLAVEDQKCRRPRKKLPPKTEIHLTPREKASKSNCKTTTYQLLVKWDYDTLRKCMNIYAKNGHAKPSTKYWACLGEIKKDEVLSN